jgi:hypothetical protein
MHNAEGGRSSVTITREEGDGGADSSHDNTAPVSIPSAPARET